MVAARRRRAERHRSGDTRSAPAVADAPQSPSEPEAGPPLKELLHRARLAALLHPVASRASTDSELRQLVARTASFFALSIAEGTRKTYARRWHLFESWCTDQQLHSLPAAPETVMLYIADSSRGGARWGRSGAGARP